VEQTAGQLFFDDTIEKFEALDLDGFVDRYHEDAVIVRFDRIIQGRAQMRQVLEAEGFFGAERHPKVRRVEYFSEAGNAVSAQMTVSTNLGESRDYDAWVLRDGKIVYHFHGEIQPPQMTPGRQFFNDTIEKFEALDLDGFIARYHEDAVIVRFDRIIEGRAQMREVLAGFFQAGLHPRLKKLLKYTETADTVFVEMAVAWETGESQDYDAWVLRDGKIAYHFHGDLQSSSSRKY